MFSSSPRASTPANPPPTNTNGSALRPTAPSGGGPDPPGGLAQHPAHVVWPDLRVVAAGVLRHVLQLTEGFPPCESATDEHERQRPAPNRLVGRRRCHVQPVQDVVAQRDRFLDLLE